VSGTGRSLLFTEDKRPQQAAIALGVNGSFEGFNIIELGPLEAAHTYSLENLGAASITAVEANAEAFLKCLIVKELLGLSRSRFLHGDVVQYLSANPPKADLIFCSGILYHMANPIELIRLMCSASDKIFVWTHYYSEGSHPSKFSPRKAEVDGFQTTYWTQRYGGSSSGFLGGINKGSCWLERDSIFSAFQHFGLQKITVIEDNPNHPNGPAITFAASRS
jgi:hypothetical protein